MTSFFLVVHMATAIVFIGALTAAASMFPRFISTADRKQARKNHEVALQLHRITTGYGRLAILTPAAGLVLALIGGKRGELWINMAIVLSAFAGFISVSWLIPAQKAALEDPGPRARENVPAGPFRRHSANSARKSVPR